jgi:predicted N-formylglutamate amidohydrolase
MRMSDIRFIVTCEHGGNRVPPRYRDLFVGADRDLTSHRGWDPGALTLAKQLAPLLDAPLITATTTRLFVDLNRSEDHPDVFSEFTRPLADDARERIFDAHYRPYRDTVRAAIDTHFDKGARVIHISSHSFTPVMRGVVRDADVGLLLDPQRKWEVALCRAIAAAINDALPALKVRRNYPYRGDSDGLTTTLRGEYHARDYAGIEIELNQRLLKRADGGRAVMAAVCRAVQSLAR